ncbi:hypothetical protein J23TS9_09210 [Paenibacillus sp. J23TS9]|nr:hypothetical protein J23TS9_09210 [Paenibacillus sp. J23TS9]
MGIGNRGLNYKTLMADSMDVSGLRLIFYVLISHEVLLNLLFTFRHSLRHDLEVGFLVKW